MTKTEIRAVVLRLIADAGSIATATEAGQFFMGFGRLCVSLSTDTHKLSCPFLEDYGPLSDLRQDAGGR